MKNFAKKVIMILTCFIIFMTNVNVVGIIKNIDVTGLLRKVEDRSSEVEANIDLPIGKGIKTINIAIYGDIDKSNNLIENVEIEFKYENNSSSIVNVYVEQVRLKSSSKIIKNINTNVPTKNSCWGFAIVLNESYYHLGDDGVYYLPYSMNNLSIAVERKITVHANGGKFINRQTGVELDTYTIGTGEFRDYNGNLQCNKIGEMYEWHELTYPGTLGIAGYSLNPGTYTFNEEEINEAQLIGYSDLFELDNPEIFIQWKAGVYGLKIIFDGRAFADDTRYIFKAPTLYNHESAKAYEAINPRLLIFDVVHNNDTLLNQMKRKPGYIFDGIYTSDGIKIIDTNGIFCNETYFPTSYNVQINEFHCCRRWYYPGDLTLYPHYTPITYSVAYNGNGNTGGTAPANTTHQYNTASALAQNTFKKEYTVSFDGNGGSNPDPIISRYNFRAWRDNATGWEWTSGATKDAIYNLTSTNGATHTLYAQWNGGAITLPGATKNAYNLTGWYNGTTKVGGRGESYTPTTNTTLTANWALDIKNIDGQITWNDHDNKYGTRPQTVDITLTSDDNGPREQGATQMTPTPTTTVTGQANTTYSFQNMQTRKVSDNTNYNYTVSQNHVTGYKTTTNGNNLTNDLILPNYSSSITYTPVDTFQNAILKNGKVKINAEIRNTDGLQYPELGVHNAQTRLNIDDAIELDSSTLKAYITDAQGTRTEISGHISGNTITNSNVIKAGEKIEIEITGKVKDIKELSSNISLSGDLRDLRGENTRINLGELTNTTKTQVVQYQMPQAKLQITKHDSITEDILTDAEFKLYEWNGTEYIEKETLTDTDGNGIYESGYYEWNKQTGGKYKVIETNTPRSHKNLNFNMEYTLNRLNQENYIVSPDYEDNTQVTKIEYTLRNPDDLDRTKGIVENEPFKIKARIDLLDKETLRQIQNPATFKIYEWDNNINQYKPYTSYTTGNEVQMARQPDNTYLSNEWLYYTKTNEGKYRIEEIQAPTGYYGDYLDDNGAEKRTYDIEILNLVSENETGNEANINITNDGNVYTNQRTKANIAINKVDSETKGEAQGNAKLQNAIYEIYAKENIYNADGLTQNYEKVDAETLGKYYAKDELIKTVETNEQGIANFENLECGQYYVKEKIQSEGYFIDETTYDVTVPYQGQDMKIVKEQRTSEEKVKKQGIKIYNAKVNDAGEHEPLQNIGYTIYRISDLSIVKDGKISRNNDGTYTLNDEEAKKDKTLKKQANKNGTYKIATLVNYYYKLNQKEGQNEPIPQDELTYHPYRIEEQKVKDYSSGAEGVEIGELTTDKDGYVTINNRQKLPSKSKNIYKR